MCDYYVLEENKNGGWFFVRNFYDLQYAKQFCCIMRLKHEDIIYRLVGVINEFK